MLKSDRDQVDRRMARSPTGEFRVDPPNRRDLPASATFRASFLVMQKVMSTRRTPVLTVRPSSEKPHGTQADRSRQDACHQDSKQVEVCERLSRTRPGRGKPDNPSRPHHGKGRHGRKKPRREDSANGTDQGQPPQKSSKEKEKHRADACRQEPPHVCTVAKGSQDAATTHAQPSIRLRKHHSLRRRLAGDNARTRIIRTLKRDASHRHPEIVLQFRFGRDIH